jgi:ABC-type multidrug transport system fused ATPase/permease subunit
LRVKLFAHLVNLSAGFFNKTSSGELISRILNDTGMLQTVLGTTTAVIVKDPATIDEQMKAVERELKETVEGYIEAKASLATLDGYIRHIDEVFSHPEQHVSLTHKPLRMSRMGVKVDQTFMGAVNELALTELSIGENFTAAIAIVRCPRSELPPKEDLVANAERYL